MTRGVGGGEISFEPLGDSAVLLRFSGNSPEIRWQKAIAACEALNSAGIAEVQEAVPAYETAAVFLRPPAEEMEERLRSALKNFRRRRKNSRRVEIPVCYDDEFALDRARVEEATNLSIAEIIDRLTKTVFTVACLGFMPGFPYLRCLRPELGVARLSTPRTKVPAGSVAIAGGQAGIYPFESPGGWNVLGRTPLCLFDPQRELPALLAPGDRVRFRAITRADFEKAR